MDRCDVELIKSVFHPDSIDEHGVFSGTGHEFADFIVPVMREHYEMTMHTISNHQAHISGETATAQTYCVTYDIRRDENGQRWLDQFGCRYLDELQRRDGDWRISKRVVVHVWDTAQLIEHGFGDTSAFAQSRRDHTDPSYSFLQPLTGAHDA